MGFRESRLFYKLIFDRFYKLRRAKFKIHLYFSREKTSNYNCHAVKVVKRKTLLYLSSLLCKTKGIFSTTIQQHDRGAVEVSFVGIVITGRESEGGRGEGQFVQSFIFQI